MTEEHPTHEPETFSSAEEETQEYKEKYLRLLADVDNTRKRMQKEKQEMTRFAIENVISEILEPIDNLENALQFTQHMSEETRSWAQGFQMILGQFKDILSNHGVTPFHSEGQKFDPRMHYAIETEETQELPEGTIIKEYVKGYRSGERIVRPARVKVAAAPKTNKTTGLPSEEAPQPATDQQN
jgi:molecular chaperone GrpE